MPGASEAAGIGTVRVAFPPASSFASRMDCSERVNLAVGSVKTYPLNPSKKVPPGESVIVAVVASPDAAGPVSQDALTLTGVFPPACRILLPMSRLIFRRFGLMDSMRRDLWNVAPPTLK